MLNNQKFYVTGSILISHKIEPILELNNDLKTFPYFTKEEASVKEGKWLSDFCLRQ